MSQKSILKNYLTAVTSLVDSLSDADFKKLDSGEYEISLRLVKSSLKENSTKSKVSITRKTLDLISEELNSVNTREAGIEIIESHLKNKSELELFAKHIDVAVMSSDKVSKIKDSIVDATVGARLRSSAIQGKEI